LHAKNKKAKKNVEVFHILKVFECCKYSIKKQLIFFLRMQILVICIT